MNNPWERIDLDVYETHMSSDNVRQLQTLNSIMKQQLTDYVHNCVAILGVAGGNGLNNVDIETTKKVYGIDINRDYLEACKQRYSILGSILELVCSDLSDTNTILPFSDILICNLIIEYLGICDFVKLLQKNRVNLKVVSCVIQKNNSNSFVSSSDLASAFDPIISVHHDIDENILLSELLRAGFKCLKKIVYPLPNGKEFIRIDCERKNECSNGYCK